MSEENNILEKELIDYAKQGDLEKLKNIIEKGIDVNIIPKTELACQGMSALHLAVRHDHPKCVQLLLEYGANADIKDNFGFRPIHDACLNGNARILSILLSHGARMDGVDRAGLASVTPVLYAAQQNNIECLELLLKNSANQDALLLDVSSKRGHLDLLEFVTKNDFDDKIVQKWMKYASLTGVNGFYQCLQRIFNRKLNKSEAQMALLTATQHGKVSCIKALIEENVDPNLADERNITALHCAARYGQCECIDILVSAGADIEAATIDNWTPLHVAVRQCQAAAVCKLIKLGCNVSAKGGEYDDTALHLAAVTGDMQIVKILLEANCDLLAANKLGKNVLQMNIKKGVKETITKFVRN